MKLSESRVENIAPARPSWRRLVVLHGPYIVPDVLTPERSGCRELPLADQ